MAKRRRSEEAPVESASEEASVSSLVDLGPASGDRLKALAGVAKEFAAGGWLPPRESLRRVRAVPTIFPQYDRATRVFGHPIDRFGLIHGESGHGKTTFANGLGMSFLARGHFYGLIDAELTTPFDWVRAQMGGLADLPSFVALRPTTYEETIGAVRRFTTSIGDAKAKGKIPEDTTGLVVVDSLKKLVPKNILDSILKESKSGKFERGVDGMRGMAGAIKAAMNAAWLDELTPLLYETGTALVAIARETEDRDASTSDKKWGRDFKVGGGAAVYYDSSIVIRVCRASWVNEKSGAEKDDDGPGEVYGERHLVEIRKTKVAGKEERATRCYFHTSNGKLTPAGFDRARDVLELAEGYEIAKAGGGGWIAWGRKRWQGRHNAVKALSAEPASLEKLEAEVRERFRPDEALPEAED